MKARAPIARIRFASSGDGPYAMRSSSGRGSVASGPMHAADSVNASAAIKKEIVACLAPRRPPSTHRSHP